MSLWSCPDRVDILSTRLPSHRVLILITRWAFSQERKVAPKRAQICPDLLHPHGYPPRASKRHTARSWGHTRELADILSVRYVGESVPGKYPLTIRRKKDRFGEVFPQKLIIYLRILDILSPIPIFEGVLSIKNLPLLSIWTKILVLTNITEKNFSILTYMKKIGALVGCFERWFTFCLQKQQSSHLIGQKLSVLMGVPLKIYNLFTDQGHSLLNSHGNCKKSRLFSKNLSSHYIATKMLFWRGIGENDLQLVYKSNKHLT